jgi:hypothetical protein
MFFLLQVLATENLLRTSYKLVFHTRITANAKTLLDYKGIEQKFRKDKLL